MVFRSGFEIVRREGGASLEKSSQSSWSSSSASGRGQGRARVGSNQISKNRATSPRY